MTTLSCPQTEISVLTGAAILDFSLPISSDTVPDCTVGIFDPENIGLAVGILFSKSSTSSGGTWEVLYPLVCVRL